VGLRQRLERTLANSDTLEPQLPPA
jgi:hypothetical protein